MSLRLRILTAILAVNLAVLALLAFLMREQNRVWRQKRAEEIQQALTADLQVLIRNFAAGVASRKVGIRPILDYGAFGLLCRDVLIVDNPLVADPELVGPDQARYPYVQINPLGAFHRDPERFSRDLVMEGIRKAMDGRRMFIVQEGFCMPILTDDGRLLGGGWFLPRSQTVPGVPIVELFLAIGMGILLLGAITYFGIDRWVLRPLQRLAEAASLLEAGRLGMQVEIPGAAREISVVGHSLNRASRLLAEQEKHLAAAVAEATERAQARERELILSGRLAAMGTLAAGLAHEINNPLGGMLNAVNLLKKMERGEKARVYLGLLEEGLARIGAIVGRTLDFAPRSTAPTVFSLGDAAEKARAMVAHRLAKQGAALRIDARGEGTVKGDAHELTQVFLNLFLNSLDAFEEGGGEEPRIHVEIRDERGEDGKPLVRAEVGDNGPGAPPEVLERIYDPFFSTKGATAKAGKLSSGLGMSISAAIIDHHGGRMRAESPSEGGFLVVIELPRVSGGGRSGR